MRAKLGRVAAVVMIGATSIVAFATAADASTPPPVTDEVDTSTPTTTTTTTVVPLVVDQPGVTPHRGTQLQVTPTEPPPPTTTTLPPPPPDQLPANSGTGRRAVYSKHLQRVWTVEADGTVSQTHRVSGRLTWNQPLPGTYSVFSRSMYTCNIKHPDICWRYMVRFAHGGDDGDNIGFHEIPKKDGVPVQTVAQLGQPLSGGCVRQATPDAVYMWNWAPVGTKVVVLA